MRQKNQLVTFLKHKRRGRFLALCFWSSLLISSLAANAFADESKEQLVKVTYIYNFGKFIVWPDSSSHASFNICVEGDQPLSGKIALLQNRQLDGRKIEVHPGIDIDKSVNCHILFISETEQQRLPEILERILAKPILTISDLPNFASLGGMIGMKVIDQRVRFDINLAVAQRANLKIDSQLLKLSMQVMQ
jgi:hypothetical protein